MSVISKVVLYKHGVGYFERVATVVGDEEVRLSFKADEMNDVLKSLTVFDSAGGGVSSVSYDNQQPISRILDESPLSLGLKGGSGALLAAVRGARVQVVVGGRTATGKVVGLEDGLVTSSGGLTKGQILTVIDDEGVLYNFGLHEILSLHFLDEHLRSELKHLFDTMLLATKSDAKSLKLLSRGQGKRKLSISYVVECPVWKASYRVALASGGAEAPYLQGWALVDNPLDEDWKEVELSLVSGLPISFRHDLYSPRYLKRREVIVQAQSSAGPVLTEANLLAQAALRQQAAEAAPPPALGMMGGAVTALPAAARPSAVSSVARSQEVMAVTQALGDLFQYRIERPVTVPRNQSALVPIVGSSFEGGRKLLYNSKECARNPLTIIEFKNTTGLTLEGGPLTVFEGGIYAGEAMLDTLIPEEERMIPYAVDLSVDVLVENDKSTQVVMESLRGGVWCQRRASYQSTLYRFSNKSDEVKEVILEHPVSAGVRVNTPEPVSESRSYWRFAVRLEPKVGTEFRVTLRFGEESKVELRHGAPEWIASVFVSARGSARLMDMVDKLRALGDRMQACERADKECSERLARIGSEQDRLRKNLGSLEASREGAALRARYVELLTAQEDELQALEEHATGVGIERRLAEEEFQELLASLDFEEIYEDDC